MYDPLRHPLFGPLLVLCIRGFHVYKATKHNITYFSKEAFSSTLSIKIPTVFRKSVLQESVHYEILVAIFGEQFNKREVQIKIIFKRYRSASVVHSAGAETHKHNTGRCSHLPPPPQQTESTVRAGRGRLCF